jgi:hypothetical protein
MREGVRCRWQQGACHPLAPSTTSPTSHDNPIQSQSHPSTLPPPTRHTSHVFQSVEDDRDKRDDRGGLDAQIRAVGDLLEGLRRQRGGGGGGGGSGGGGIGGDRPSSSGGGAGG